MKPVKLAAIVLCAAGAVLLIFGIIRFVEFRQSFGGKLSSWRNQLSQGIGGSSKVADGYVKPILLMAGGVVSGAAGFFLSRKR